MCYGYSVCRCLVGGVDIVEYEIESTVNVNVLGVVSGVVVVLGLWPLS